MTTSTPSQFSPSYEAIKLGIDAHAKYYWVSRQVDGATPQPVRKMTYAVYQVNGATYKIGPAASKVLTPGRVGGERLEKVVDSKKMTPATERDADGSKDS